MANLRVESRVFRSETSEMSLDHAKRDARAFSEDAIRDYAYRDEFPPVCVGWPSLFFSGNRLFRRIYGRRKECRGVARGRAFSFPPPRTRRRV